MSKRTKSVLLRLTEDELLSLDALVKRTALSREAYIRNAIFAVQIREHPPADVPYLLREFKRIGNNINQILLIANTNGFLDAPRLRSALDELKEADRLVFRTYARKD